MLLNIFWLVDNLLQKNIRWVFAVLMPVELLV